MMGAVVQFANLISINENSNISIGSILMYAEKRNSIPSNMLMEVNNILLFIVKLKIKKKATQMSSLFFSSFKIT
jgi:type III secretion system FlhB-like substrate exporter